MTRAGEKIASVKGMSDIMPPESGLWQDVESKARQVFGAYGYHEIRTPIVERTELFQRGVGETTSVVEKEMYSFTDQGGEALSLRPEGTAAIVRAYIESGAHASESIARYYCMGPMFRRERPQRGRQRQFYQIGSELIGAASPLADAEVMAMTSHFFEEIGLSGFDIEVNSIGCPECRPAFNDALLKFLKSRGGKLCEDCLRRIERNPMRALDCRQDACRGIMHEAPAISEYICEGCERHFGEVQRALAGAGVKYAINGRIVRGLDYYMRTAFEFTSEGLGAQNAIAGGGRYDGLVRALGGPDVPGVGVALGMERVICLLEGLQKKPPREDVVFFAVIGEAAQHAALPIIQALRRDGVRVEWSYAKGSLKGQMRQAGRAGAEAVVIIGDDEIARGEAQVRDMRAGTQRTVKIKDLPMRFVQIGG